MLSGAKGIELWQFQQNSAWTVTDTSWKVEEEKKDATITFSITLKRKPMFFILSVILPISMLALLNICVFLLPCDSGEKTGYAMTVFLAFAVFLTIVSSTLPQNSEKISIVSVFLIIQTVASTLITIIALGMRRVNDFPDDKPVPPWVYKVMRFLMFRSCQKKGSPKAPEWLHKVKHFLVSKCRACRKKDTPTVAPAHDTAVNTAMNGATIEEKIDLAKDEPQPDSSTEDENLTWKEVVDFSDVFFIIVFSVVLILSGFICFTVAAGTKQK